MLDSTLARALSKSPLSEGGLTAEVRRRAALDVGDRAGMYALLEAYFENTSYGRFERDLEEKELAILLRDAHGDIAGFTTLMSMAAVVDDRPVTAFFSGDTIVAREHWGSPLLSRCWINTVWACARVRALDDLVYWFLICSGYKTFRFLPVFFREFLPVAGSAFERRLLATLAVRKFGSEYDAGAGVVRLRVANPLRAGVAPVTGERRRDPMVEFFTRANPGHERGDELACLTSLAPGNLTRAGRRMVGAGESPC